MNTINEMCLAWYMWVNGNYDILIMTITLIVVAGLVLEVVRLKGRIEAIEVRADWNVEDLNNRLNHLDDAIETARLGWYTHESKLDDQVNVNVHLAEDIARIDGKENDNREFTDKVYAGLVSVNNWQDSVAVRFTDLEKKSRKGKKAVKK